MIRENEREIPAFLPFPGASKNSGPGCLQHGRDAVVSIRIPLSPPTTTVAAIGRLVCRATTPWFTGRRAYADVSKKRQIGAKRAEGGTPTQRAGGEARQGRQRRRRPWRVSYRCRERNWLRLAASS